MDLHLLLIATKTSEVAGVVGRTSGTGLAGRRARRTVKLASLSARGRRGPDFAGIVRKLVPLLGLSLLTGVPLSALEPPKAELFGGYSFLRSDRNDYRRRNFQGWNLSLARSINHRVEIVGDFDGHYGGIAGASTSFRSASLLF